MFAGASGLISNQKVNIIQQIDGSYKCNASLYQSDHKPVENQYLLKVTYTV